MQKVVFILSCVVLLAWACGGKDKAEVAAEVTAETTEVSKSSEQIRGVQQRIQAKVDSLGSAVNTVPDTSRLGITLNGRYKLDNILERGEQIKRDLAKLAADQAAGKITSAEYEQQFKVLQELSKKYAETAKQLSENISKTME